VWISVVIWFITQHSIDRRVGETSYIEGYANISNNSSVWEGRSEQQNLSQ
jgi:hypothetical protein